MNLQSPTPRYQNILIASGFLTLLGAIIWSFQPGLGGVLTFDDIPNLQPWHDIGDIDTWPHLLTYVFSGQDTPGRPLSLLSFLIDDQGWQPDIFSLKRTNLALHLINASLIFWLCLKLFRLLPGITSTYRQMTLALLATAVWSLHPIQVSNVSYIIQRMNLLSTLFELTGLLLFIHGREQLAQSPRRAIAISSMAIGLFMPLAVLSKENGLLLCAFALLVEAFCFPRVQTVAWQAWRLAFLWAPLLAFATYCLVIFHGFTLDYPARGFSSWERLLTQGPVVADYLEKLLAPRLHGSGLYFDNFPVSRSLLHPANTFYAWLVISTLLGLAWYLRKRLPIFSFGIFFYFCGHIMESTLLPLELYFEHRNYLPQIGLWIALSSLLNLVPSRVFMRNAAVVMALILTAILMLLTHDNSSLWSDHDKQTAVWYNENPESLRTTLAYSNLLLQRHDYDTLFKVLKQGRITHPNSMVLLVSERYVSCYWQDKPTRFDDLKTFAQHADHENASIEMLEQMRQLAANAATVKPVANGCTPLTDIQIADIYLALLDNPRYVSPHSRACMLEYVADVAYKHGDLNSTMHYYDLADATSPDPVYAYRQATYLLSAGLPEDAASYVQKSEQRLTLRKRALYPELPGRIEKLKEDLARMRRRAP